MRRIETDSAPRAIGPYSQAVVSSGFIFTSGQISLSPETGQLAGSCVAEQAAQICENIKGLLQASGSNMECVVKTTCFLVDMDDYAAFNEVYALYFPGCPARSCIAVRELPKGALCEIEVIAQIPQTGNNRK